MHPCARTQDIRKVVKYLLWSRESKRSEQESRLWHRFPHLLPSYWRAWWSLHWNKCSYWMYSPLCSLNCMCCNRSCGMRCQLWRAVTDPGSSQYHSTQWILRRHPVENLQTRKKSAWVEGKWHMETEGRINSHDDRPHKWMEGFRTMTPKSTQACSDTHVEEQFSGSS